MQGSSAWDTEMPRLHTAVMVYRLTDNWIFGRVAPKCEMLGGG